MSSSINPFQDRCAGLPADVELIAGPDYPAKERGQPPLKSATNCEIQEEARHGWLRFLPECGGIPKLGPWVAVVSVALVVGLLGCLGH